jgi:hypothetical protein
MPSDYRFSKLLFEMQYGATNLTQGKEETSETLERRKGQSLSFLEVEKISPICSSTMGYI